MKTLHHAVCLLGTVMLINVTTASAQVPAPATEKFYVNVNVGGQLAERTVNVHSAPTIYEEPATFDSTVPVARGVIFDFGGGYRVWEDVYVGLSISTFGDSGSGTWTASIPHFLFQNRPLARAGTDPSELKHRETAFSPNVIYARTLTDKIDITAGLGLSIIKVKQDLVATFSVPAATQNVITGVTATSGTATGIYANVDFIYNLAPRYGVGGFLRYAGGKTDLKDDNGNVVAADVNAGGVQIGGGIRLRF